MGGLYDGTRLIASFFVGPLAAFTLNSELLTAIMGDESRAKKVSSINKNSRTNNNTAKDGKKMNSWY